MTGEIPAHILVGTLAFAIGIAFGAVTQRANFCTMGALSDIALIGDYRRFRSWMLAVAVAILASQALHLAGAIDLDRSVYLAPSLGWLGAILGGLLFGFGMTLTGGCASRTLVRLGSGNLKALVSILVLAVVAYMTLRGLIGVVRVRAIEATNLPLTALGADHQGVPDLLAALIGLELPWARSLAALAAGVGLLWYCLKNRAFRSSFRHLGAGLAIGSLVAAGWAVTGILGADEFEPTPLASLSFVAPVADGLQYLMTYTGAKLSFGVAVVGGVILGAFLAAIASGSFRIEGFADRADLVRHLAGAAFMGTGGVLALGCTIGQGITGLSTLAGGSLIAFLSIVAGALWGLKFLEEGSVTGALKALLGRG